MVEINSSAWLPVPSSLSVRKNDDRGDRRKNEWLFYV